MIRSFLFLAAILAASSQANAAWLTQYATVDRGTDGDVTFLQTITGATSDGLSFTNTIDSTTGGVDPGDTRRIVSVGANLLSGYVRTTDMAPFQVPTTFDGDPVVAVYALEGTSTQGAGPGLGNALFDTGRVAFYTVDEGTFNRFDPTTWGAFDPVTGLMNAPIAIYDLANPDSIGPGTIDGNAPDPDGSFNLLASQVNVSAINAVTPVNTQGNFLFTESETYVGPTRSANYIEVTGPDFSGNVDEAIVVRSDQAIVLNPLLGGGINPARLDALNLIAVELGGLGGNAAGGFATGIGGALATDYNLTVNPALTGDLRATLGLTVAPLAVPEPASVVVWSLIGVSALPIIRRHRRRQQQAAV